MGGTAFENAVAEGKVHGEYPHYQVYALTLRIPIASEATFAETDSILLELEDYLEKEVNHPAKKPTALGDAVIVAPSIIGIYALNLHLRATFFAGLRLMIPFCTAIPMDESQWPLHRDRHLHSQLADRASVGLVSVVWLAFGFA